MDAAPDRSTPAGFWVVWSTVALDLVGFGIVLPLLPLFADELGAGELAAAGLVAAFSAAQFAFAPLWGRLSDRIGRKPVLVMALCGSAIGSLVTGFADSLWVLYLGRLIDGASGSSYAVAQAAVSDLARPANRPRLLGLLGAAFGVGFVMGPVIGGLAALGGRRLPFYVAAALAAANAVVTLFRLPETRPAPADIGERPARRRLPTVAWRLVALGFVGMFAFSGFESTFALLVDRRFDVSRSVIYVLLAGIGIALVLVQARLIGPLTDRFGEYRTLRLALLAVGAGMLVLAAGGGWVGLALALALLVVGQGSFGPVLASGTVGVVEGERRGEMLGYQASAGALGRIVGPVVAGALFQHVGVAAPYAAAAAVVVVAIAVVPVAVRSRGPSFDDVPRS